MTHGKILLPLAAALLLTAIPEASASARPASWFSVWSRPQNVVLASAADPLDGGRGPGPLVDQSVRDIVQSTGSGDRVRVRLTNRFGATYSPDGSTPLTVLATTLARRSRGAALTAGTLHRLSFRGRSHVTIAPGATVVSDPVPFPLLAGQDLAVSLHVEFAPVAPAHGNAFVTSYVAPARTGDHTRDLDGHAFTRPTRSGLVLTGVDVRSRTLPGVIATTGGSVTDGFGSDIDRHTDYPSWLSRRIRMQLPKDRQKAVVNNGLGGTTAATACSTRAPGPSVQERVAHDSLSLPGVRTLIVYAGTNDIGGACNAADIIAGLVDVVHQAHARGVRVLISTITPRASFTAAQNAQRAAVNRWIRRDGTCSKRCDKSLDFDKVVRDPRNLDQITPALDSGDGIHPTGEGYRRIAASIPLSAV